MLCIKSLNENGKVGKKSEEGLQNLRREIVDEVRRLSPSPHC